MTQVVVRSDVIPSLRGKSPQNVLGIIRAIALEIVTTGESESIFVDLMEDSGWTVEEWETFMTVYKNRLDAEKRKLTQWLEGEE